MRIVSVTPAGRRRYLRVLVQYLLRNRDVIDEHHWWLNTRDPDDVAYVYRISDRFPDFFKVVAKPMDPNLSLGEGIWSYLRDCTDPDTIYARFDDDICYMADDAIAKLCEYRQQHRDPLLVLGNIVNNAVCAHFHQQAGLIPRSWGEVSNECMDDVGWRSGLFARRLHLRFLKDIEKGVQDRWKTSLEIDGCRRFSINAISWYGADLAEIPEIHEKRVEEESFITTDLPTRLGRPNVVCSDALFGHYAFWTQRKYLDWTSPDIMERYGLIAQDVAPIASRRPILKRTLDGLSWSARNTTWRAKYAPRELGRFLRRKTNQIRARAA